MVGIFKAVTGKTDLPSFYWPEVVKIRRGKNVPLQIPVSGMLMVLKDRSCVNYRNKGKKEEQSFLRFLSQFFHL